MGKNDDFAARLARVKEQTNAPDPTRGTTTDPRQAGMAQRGSTSSAATSEMPLVPGFVIGGLAAIALAAYLLSPQSDEGVAAAMTSQETRTTPNLFEANLSNRVGYSGDETEAPVSKDETSYAQTIRAKKAGNITESETRVALLGNNDRSEENTNFDLPNDVHRSVENDDPLSELTKTLNTEIESE